MALFRVRGSDNLKVVSITGEKIILCKQSRPGNTLRHDPVHQLSSYDKDVSMKEGEASQSIVRRRNRMWIKKIHEIGGKKSPPSLNSDNMTALVESVTLWVAHIEG